jgi:membrane protein involved in colicin uptake
MAEKATIYLSNGQVFKSPLENVPTVRRLYKSKIVKIEYPDETKTETITQTASQPKKQEADAVAADKEAEAKLQAEKEAKLKEQADNELKAKQDAEAKAAEAAKAKEEADRLATEAKKQAEAINSGEADYGKSKERLSRANLKNKTMAELRGIIAEMGTGFTSSTRKKLEDHIILEQK